MSTIATLTVALVGDSSRFDSAMRSSRARVRDFIASMGSVRWNSWEAGMLNISSATAAAEAKIRALSAATVSMMSQMGAGRWGPWQQGLANIASATATAATATAQFNAYMHTLIGQFPNADAGINRLSHSFNRLRDIANRRINVLPGSLSYLLSGYMVGQGIKKSVSLAADFEASEKTMAVLLRDTAKAKTLVSELYEFAAKTPFQFPEVMHAEKLLLGVGENAKTAQKQIARLGDVALALNIPLEEMAGVFARNRNQAHIFSRDINEFASRGVPIIQELAKNLRVADSDIKQMVEDGKIGFKDIDRAFETMTEKGGQFHNMTKELGQTMKGRLSTALDDFNMSLKQLGDVIGPPAVKVLAQMADALRETSELLLRINPRGGPVGIVPTVIDRSQKAVSGAAPKAASEAQKQIDAIDAQMREILKAHAQVSQKAQGTSRWENLMPGGIVSRASGMNELNRQYNDLARLREQFRKLRNSQGGRAGAGDAFSMAFPNAKETADKFRDALKSVGETAESVATPLGKLFHEAGGRIRGGMSKKADEDREKANKKFLEGVKKHNEELERDAERTAEKNLTIEEKYLRDKQRLQSLYENSSMTIETRNRERVRLAEERDKELAEATKKAESTTEHQEARKIYEQNLTAQEKYLRDKDRLNILYDNTAMTRQTHRRELARLGKERDEDLKKELKKENMKPGSTGAAEVGSKEAWSTMIRAMNPKGESIPSKQLNVAEQQLAELKQLNGKAKGAPIGTEAARRQAIQDRGYDSIEDKAIKSARRRQEAVARVKSDMEDNQQIHAKRMARIKAQIQADVANAHANREANLARINKEIAQKSRENRRERGVVRYDSGEGLSDDEIEAALARPAKGNVNPKPGSKDAASMSTKQLIRQTALLEIIARKQPKVINA